MNVGESASSFPVESLVEIIVAIALVIIALKLAKSIAKPLFAVIVAISAALLIFGVVDIATFASTGERLIGDALSCAGSKISDTDVGQIINQFR